MKAWSIVFWISLGALIDHLWFPVGRFGTLPLALLLVVALLGWGWSALAAGAFSLYRRFAPRVTGRPVTLPRTDPQALAEEMTALHAQLSQLRETATSFDVSFDQTLQHMDERLRRVEQQSPYIQIRPGS